MYVTYSQGTQEKNENPAGLDVCAYTSSCREGKGEGRAARGKRDAG